MKKDLFEKELSKVFGGSIFLGDEGQTRESFLKTCRMAYKHYSGVMARSSLSIEEKEARLQHMLNIMVNEGKMRGYDIKKEEITKDL